MRDQGPKPFGSNAADQMCRQPLVEAISIGVQFGDFTAISDVSLRLERGETVAIVGPSGCGKTTILKCIAGLLPPTSGRIDHPSTSPSVSLMFQRSLLQPWLTVEEIVQLPCRILGHEQCKALEWLRIVGLDDRRNDYPWGLSGGMRRRVSLARALAAEPGLLLLDEPFYGLDEITKEEIFGPFQAALERSKAGVLIVTHNITEAALLADRIAVLSPAPAITKGIVSIKTPRPRPWRFTESEEFRQVAGSVRRLLRSNDEAKAPNA